MRLFFLLVVAGFSMLSNAAFASISFIYDDHSGTPNAGTYAVGQVITFDIQISFTNPPADAAGISYWFETGALSSGYFSLTSRNLGASPFSVLAVPISSPELLDPQTNTDLGGLTSSNLTPGTYFVATVSFSVNPGAQLGNYVIENTTTGGMTSVLSDGVGTAFPISQAQYHVHIVPEPPSAALLLPAAALLAFRRKKT